MTLPCDSSDDIDTLLVDDRVGRVRFHGASFLDTFRARCFPCNGGGIRTVSPSRTGVCTHAGAAVSAATAAWPWLLLSSPPSTGVCKRSIIILAHHIHAAVRIDKWACAQAKRGICVWSRVFACGRLAWRHRGEVVQCPLWSKCGHILRILDGRTFTPHPELA